MTKKTAKKKTTKVAATRKATPAPTNGGQNGAIIEAPRPNWSQPLADRKGAETLKHYILWYVANKMRHGKLSPDQVGISYSLALLKNRRLMQCTKISVAEACFKAALLGLEFSGATGDAYLVPFKTTCQLIPGYQGYIQAYMKSGDISTLQAHLIYACDTFKYALGTQPKLTHDPDCLDPRFGEPKYIVAAYMFAHIKGSAHPNIEMMSRTEINKIRARSKAANDGPWVTDFGEMARKTVLKRGRKWLPRIDVIDRLLLADAESTEYDTPEDLVDQVGEDEEPKSQAQALADQLSSPPVEPQAAPEQPAAADPMNDVIDRLLLADAESEEALALRVKLAIPDEAWLDAIKYHTVTPATATQAALVDWSLVIDAMRSFAEKRSRDSLGEDMF